VKKFILPISPNYVHHWGLWEAIRELYQNALDATDLLGGEASLTYEDYPAYKSPLLVRVVMVKSLGHLAPASLLLGSTTKNSDSQQRGKFGEGYKLALLVLARLGLAVEVFNGDERWSVAIEHSEEFDAKVLTITVDTNYTPVEGVEFVIGPGVTDEQWEKIQSNVRPTPKYDDQILEEPQEKGRIYVGGLYVTTMKEFHYGYSFQPGRINLDRDRGMVDNFDLAWVTSQLWSRKDNERAIKLLEDEAPDVEYVKSHATTQSPITVGYYGHYQRMHGESVPVSTQEEIERATAAGVKWTLVKDAAKQLLWKVGTWFIPTTLNPAERLRKFIEKHRYQLNDEMKRELNEILSAMEGKSNGLVNRV
jgi:hypothetical protein